jgi:hypothetical protein
MKSEYIRIKLTKKRVKKRVFYGKEFLAFSMIFKIKNGNTNYEKKNQK